ncbi:MULTISPECIES: sensor histidine kinase [unclassified Acinetobacter]|jgi:two-component system sensor histidine kinase PilS (NtrC family)|uniref:sensor histidine kinase n=1 Tax=unclassified Acinetobacter TaxID=196816 RepID=UPI000A33496C|nr:MULTISPECIES: ATP-binding protein [unclassified Acinetobacter]OTG74123.1 histidine kinase [Acinetobacter sp. ANC 4218]QQN39651.1 histidine kinase [Acinetobacter sp. CS-2]
MTQNSYTLEFNQYHLGIWYSTYRLIIATSLLLIFLLTYQRLSLDYHYQQLYLYVLIGYVSASFIQLIILKSIRFKTAQQLPLLFVVDVIALSLLTLAVDGPNLQLSLLFVITIFAASLLLDAQKALIITLIAVISVIYQLFLGSIFDFSSLNNIGNSAILAFLFLVVYGSGQIAVKRFQLLENLNFSQSLELNRLQNLNRYILEQIELGYLVLDENCHIVLSNPAACLLLGIPPLYAYDKYPLYKAQPDLFELLKFDQLRDGEKFQFESQLSHYHMHIEVQKLMVPQQTLTLLVLQDATKLNQRVQQLKLAALGQLSASIAHEIRNPLAAIVQANELLSDSDPHQQAVLSRMIAKQTQRIDRIVQDTLNMVRNKETHPSTIELKQFIPLLILEDLADIAPQIKYTVQSKIFVHFDEAQLRQVLINLIRNAIRHNAPEHSHIELNVYLHDNNVRIDVRDFGAGVASKDLAYLFQPFFSTEITGTGLGLYLSHSFCEANQAKLNYVKQEQGACFRIECLQVAL